MRVRGWPAAAPALAALAFSALALAQGDAPVAPVAKPPAPQAAPGTSRPPARGAATTARPKVAAPTGGPSWASLGEPARGLLQPFESQWNSWSPQEKRIWVSLAAKFPKLTPEKQAKVRGKIVEWAALTPAQRKLARANFRLARQLPTAERVSQWQRYESMTPEQRKVLRIGGRTSNTAAKHAGARTGLAKEAATPLGETEPVWPEDTSP